MSEKRHKINKFANYQNIIVRNTLFLFLLKTHSRPQSHSFPYHVTKKRRALGTRMLKTVDLWIFT